MSDNIKKTVDSYESIMKETSKKSSKMAFNKTYPAYIILLLFIGLSLVIWDFMKDSVNNANLMEFNKAKTSVMNRLVSIGQKKIDILKSMSSLYEESPDVVRYYFELYGTLPTKTYPAIYSLSYVAKIEGANISEFIFNSLRQGYNFYNIQPSGQREIYYPVQHNVPFPKNESRLGYDLASEPILKKYIEIARDENKFVTTPILRIRIPDTIGFYMFAPIYKYDSLKSTITERKKNFDAVLALEIDVKKFYDYALGITSDNKITTPSDTTIIFDITEINDESKESVIYKSFNYNLKDSGYKPQIEEVEVFKLADREYKVKFATVPNFGGKFQSYFPIISLVGSLFLSFAFFGFVLSVITSRARAVDLAERMTRSQRRIVESSKDIIAVLDFNGNWKSMNPASQSIFGIDSNNLINQNINVLIYDDIDKNFLTKIVENVRDEETERIDIKMKSFNGEMKWLNWSLTISKTDGLIYAIGRDVTLEKLAEQEAILKSKQIQLAELFAREASESKTFFMTKLSHQLRNSLTGIIGYLQLLSMKLYENEEEQDSFINLAEQSSEEIFQFVSDIVDATIETDKDASAHLEIFRIEKVLTKANSNFKQINKSNKNVKLEPMDDTPKARVLADVKLLSDSISMLMDVLSSGMDNCLIEINATENTYEGATEIQILSASNQTVEEMIEVFKNNQTNLIGSLKQDKNDIVLGFAKVSSNIRRMGGNVSLDSLGKDGNLVNITLPLNKQLS